MMWSVAIVQLIALLFKDQNVTKIQRLLALTSANSDSSEDDVESDTSKNSGSASGFSIDSTKDHVSNDTAASDSGYPRHSEEVTSLRKCCSTSCTSPVAGHAPQNCLATHYTHTSHAPDVHLSNVFHHHHHHHHHKTEGVLTCVESKICQNVSCSLENIPNGDPYKILSDNRTDDSEEVHHNKCSLKKKILLFDKNENLVTSDLGYSDKSEEEAQIVLKSGSSDNELHSKLLKLKPHQHTQWLTKTNSESDSSNEEDDSKIKFRSHPPVGWKSKGVGECKYQHCSSSLCLNAALEVAARKGHISTNKEAILEKRRKIRMLTDNLAHNPSDEDISNLLRDFTLTFLHNGFCDLVIDLKTVISVENPLLFDKSHFLWLLTYFLRLSSAQSLAYYHISSILSSDMISYLTFEGVTMCEELELISRSQQMDIEPLLRRMHLLVTAFRELFTSVDNLCKKPIAKREKASFQKLIGDIAGMTDVRKLFLLLIRKCNPQVHSKQYLIDVISTNHILLMLLEKVYIDPEMSERIDLPGHIKHFGTAKVMEVYGKVLEDYKMNSEMVNDYIFTMMHHMVGEVNSVQSLFQPVILRSFCKILQDDFQTKEVWEDLMNYVLSEFMRAVERSPEVCVQKLFGLMTVNSEGMDRSTTNSSLFSSLNSEESNDDLASTQLCNQNNDLLYWWYLQYEHHSDPVGKIQEGLEENQIFRSRLQVLHELLSQGIVSKSEYDTLISKETSHMMYEDSVQKEDDVQMAEWDSVLHSVRSLIVAGYKVEIGWLQRTFLEACYVKSELTKNENHPVENSVPFYSHVTRQNIPLVPYTESQEAALQSEMFTNLLRDLGLHMTTDVGKLYPRIPSFWTTDVLYSIAQRLGPISQQKDLLFNLKELEMCLKNIETSSPPESMNEEFQVFSPTTSTQSSFSTPLRMEYRNNTSNQNSTSTNMLEDYYGAKITNGNVPNNSVQLLAHQRNKHVTPSLPHGHVPAVSSMNWMALASKSKVFEFPTASAGERPKLYQEASS